MTTPLRVDRLYRFYRADDEETLALRGVSFELEPGEVVVVAGPSGSGKTTLLSCVAGIDEPSGGTVWINGQRMSHQPESVRARLRADNLGLLGQSGNLFDHLTVIQNLRLVQRLSSRRAVDPSSLLDRLGLTQRAHHTPAMLSSGEAARAALTAAVINDPLVLVADEPTGELDEAMEEQVLGLLRAHADGGGSVLVSSHSPAVRRAADRVLVLEDGVLQP